MSEYRTSDLALCAFLLLDGHRFREIEKVSEQQAVMVFEDGDELIEAVREYETGNAEVEPRDFLRKVAFVRNRMRDAVRDQGRVGS
jgi:Domain of unknown function (DUF5659)